jgi:ABC-type uncharacterized transport system substrate-binding protein
MRVRLSPLIFAIALLAWGPAVEAHPHVWVMVHSELIYAADGSLTGIQNHWTFDESYSAFATQGLANDEKGGFTTAALAPLAKVNIDSLREFHYFTFAKADGHKVPMADPLPGYRLDYRDRALTLHFVLPFKHPVSAKALAIEIYDPTIFVDFEFAKETPVRLVGAPAQCKLNAQTASGLTPSQSLTLGEAFFNSLSASSNWGERFANKILVNCP